VCLFDVNKFGQATRTVGARLAPREIDGVPVLQYAERELIFRACASIERGTRLCMPRLEDLGRGTAIRVQNSALVCNIECRLADNGRLVYALTARTGHCWIPVARMLGDIDTPDEAHLTGCALLTTLFQADIIRVETRSLAPNLEARRVHRDYVSFGPPIG
jgi:hypothetical protein